MKKILSLVLAVALLSSMALAADVTLGTSNVNGFGVATPSQSIGAKPANFALDNDSSKDLDNLGYRFNNDNFSISAKTFSKGANLVEKVAISDDDMEVQITLKQDYSLARPKNVNAADAAPNVVIKKLAVKAKNNINVDTTNDSPKVTYEVVKNKEYVYGGTKEMKIGYIVADTIITDGSVEYIDGSVAGQMAKFTEEDYGTASQTFGDIYLEGRVYKGDKVYTEVKTTPSDAAKAIMKENGDAEMRFYRLLTNGLPSNNIIQLAAEEDEFVYQIKDGKLVESGLKWNDDDYAWVGKVRSSVEYIVSDIELVAAPAESGTETAPDVTNPDTGANDVVGIAAALAVVSLVAAGAVSLKK